MKKNLVLIDNYQLLDPRRPNVCIGYWCLRDEKIRQLYKKGDNKISIQDYHWDNKDKLKKDIKIINKLYYKTLRKISKLLNNYHNVKNSTSYWEIIIGYWLKNFISFSYDRWFQYKCTLKTNNIGNIKTYLFDDKSFVTNNTLEFSTLIRKKSWNLWIFSKISSFLNKNKISRINSKINSGYIEKFSKKKNIYLDLINETIFKKNIKEKKLIISNLYLPIQEKIKLSFYFDKGIHKIEFISDYSKETKLTERKKIFKGKFEKKNFENFMYTIFPFAIPRSFFENYKKMINSERFKNLPSNPRFLLTSHDHIINDFFKIYCAEKKKKCKAKLAVFQHGGSYNLYKDHINEKLEYKIADKFFSWGWYAKEKSVVPFYNFKTINKSIKKKTNAVGLLFPIFLSYFYPDNAVNSPRHFKDMVSYTSMISNFISNLDRRITKLSSFKYKKIRTKESKNHYTKKKLSKNFPNLKKIIVDESAVDVSKNYKLIVDSNISTGFFEAMSLNIPIILIIEKKYENFSFKFRKIFKLLKKANIAFTDELSAAKFVNKIYSDGIDKWWNSNKAIIAKNAVIKNYSNNKIKPTYKLIRELNKVSN